MLDGSTFREYNDVMQEAVDEVIRVLGGPAKVAGLCGVGTSAVSNWKARGRIPPEKFFIFERALASLDKRADPAIFGFVVDEARA